MGLVGFIISISTTVVAARYIALFLQAGSYAGYVSSLERLHKAFPLTIAQLHRLLLMDQFILPPSSCQTRSSNRPDQRIQPDRQHHRLVRVVR